MSSPGFPWAHRLLLAIVGGMLAALASHGGWLQALDNAAYDRFSVRWQYPADPSLLIVAIDEASLQQIGQWPWPRTVHARLLDRLTEAGAHRVALDLLLSEPDHHEGADAALAAAIRRNGQVVLPVLAVPASDQQMAEELLPIPLIAHSAAALGHRDVEVDADGVARGVYLYAGIGRPHWPALGLALADPPRPAQQQAPDGDESAYQWNRDDYVRLRYAGPPGTFPQVSYADVLNGRVDASLLRDRRILVAATARAIAPPLLTPSARNSGMSVAEYQANIASMWLQTRTVRLVPPIWQASLTGLLVALCVLVLTGGRSVARLGVATALPLPSLLSFGLLRAAGWWWAPAAATAGILVAVAIWAGCRIVAWRRRSTFDAFTGLATRQCFEQVLRQECDASQRSHRPLSLVLIGVDQAKRDGVLTRVADLVCSHARRPRDLPSRFGSDTFAMLLPDTPASGARQVVEELIADARRLQRLSEDGPPLQVTLSIGVFCRIGEPGLTPDAFIAGAEAAQRDANARGAYVLDGG